MRKHGGAFINTPVATFRHSPPSIWCPSFYQLLNSSQPHVHTHSDVCKAWFGSPKICLCATPRPAVIIFISSNRFPKGRERRHDLSLNCKIRTRNPPAFVPSLIFAKYSDQTQIEKNTTTSTRPISRTPNLLSVPSIHYTKWCPPRYRHRACPIASCFCWVITPTSHIQCPRSLVVRPSNPAAEYLLSSMLPRQWARSDFFHHDYDHVNPGTPVVPALC